MNELKKQFFRPRHRSNEPVKENFEEIVMMGPVARKGSWRLWLLVGVFLIILGLSVYALFFSEYFRVRNVEISGGTDEIRSDIEKMLSWESDYMVLFNEKKFSQTVADKYNDLAGVEIEKIWPDRLKIVLIPEIAKIIWKTEGKLYLVNASGVVLGLIEEPERLAKFNDLPVITDNSNLPVEDGNKVVSRDFVTFIDMAKSSIDMSVKKDIESYEVEETTFNLRIKFKEGFWAYFDTLRNAELQVEKLAVFLNQGKLVDQYVDLRVPGKIFYQ